MKRILKRLLLVPVFPVFLATMAGLVFFGVLGGFWVVTGEYFPDEALDSLVDRFETLTDWANR